MQYVIILIVKKLLYGLLTAFILLFLAFLVVPFLVPVPALQATLTEKQLADPDSRFAEIKGLDVHFKRVGSGTPALLLLHGFASNLYTWQYVLSPIAEGRSVVTFDRPAFGLTERVFNWEDENPYSPEFQADLTIGLMDYLGIEKAVLVGNSAGGAISVFTTLRYPERVQALILVDAAIYEGGGAPDWVKPLLATPQMRRLGPLISRSLLSRADELVALAYHDPNAMTAEMLAAYEKTSKVANWDKALWEFTLASRDLRLSTRLFELDVPVLVITGDDDRIVPTADSLRLATDIPAAQLVVLSNCGHVPQEECPQPFLEAVNLFLTQIDK